MKNPTNELKFRNIDGFWGMEFLKLNENESKKEGTDKF